jgi:Protein of unknown function (DUF3750)
MRSGRMLWLGSLLILVVVPLVWSAGVVHGSAPRHWSQARWDSAGLAPDPATTPEPVVQVYAARAWGWKGIFATHSWIIMKRANAPAFERYEVVGWGVGSGAPAIRKNMRTVDGYWAGSRPWVLVDRRGPEVETLIDRLEAAIASYPYQDEYRTWPGPNSNTFIADLGRRVPELGLTMPPTAIGKDYLDNGSLLARTPSGSGFQLSLLGLLGLAIGRDEGLEVNVLGLIFGVDPLGLALKLPFVGRLGLT